MNYRKTTADDLERLNRWIALDPAHKDVITGSFFVPQPADTEESKDANKGIAYVTVEDDDGAVFYLRLENCTRVYAQFPPDEEKNDHRLTRALKHAFVFIAKKTKELGSHEMLFDSVSDTLVGFFKRFHFEELKNTFQVKL